MISPNSRSMARRPTSKLTFVGTRERSHSSAAGSFVGRDSRARTSSSVISGRIRVKSDLHVISAVSALWDPTISQNTSKPTMGPSPTMECGRLPVIRQIRGPWLTGVVAGWGLSGFQAWLLTRWRRQRAAPRHHRPLPRPSCHLLVPTLRFYCHPRHPPPRPQWTRWLGHPSKSTFLSQSIPAAPAHSLPLTIFSLLVPSTHFINNPNRRPPLLPMPPATRTPQTISTSCHQWPTIIISLWPSSRNIPSSTRAMDSTNKSVNHSDVFQSQLLTSLDLSHNHNNQLQPFVKAEKL